MKLNFPYHIQDKLLERLLSIDHITSAIRSPDATEVLNDGRIMVTKKFGDKEISVLYYKNAMRKKKLYKIITAYYL